MKSLLSLTTSKIGAFFKYIWENKFKPKVFLSTIAVLVAIFMFANPGNGGATYEIIEAKSGDFIQEVSVTGKVTPAEKVDLSFEVGGRIAKIDATVGQVVKKGTVLASISNADYLASLQKSQAAYQNEQARLREIERGSRPEELAIAEADLQVAIQNVNQAKLQLIEEIKDSYAKADDAIKNKADLVFRNPRSVNPEFIYFVDGNPSLKTSIEYQRLRVTEQFPAWQKLVSSITAENLSDAKVNEARGYLLQVQNLLNDLNSALTATSQNLDTNSTNESYRASIFTARSNINLAIQELNTAYNTLRNNESARNRAEESLGLKKAGSTEEEIAAQRAMANSAAAGITSASASLNKTLIIAPFDGVVTRVSYKTGESISPTDSVITLMSDAAYEIETFVSETDVPKLKVGQTAKVTLDALGDAIVFDAVINQVDLSETIKDGIVTYKTRMQFISKDERIRSGLTANVTVETDRRSDVIKVPQAAIVIVKGKKHIKIAPKDSTEWSPVVDKQSKLEPVTTGGIDREGDIEVTSGITSGDKIITRAETN